MTPCEQPLFYNYGVVNGALRLDNDVIRRSMSSPDAIMFFVGEALTGSVRRGGVKMTNRPVLQRMVDLLLTLPKSKPDRSKVLLKLVTLSKSKQDRRKVVVQLSRLALALRAKIHVQAVSFTMIIGIRAVRIQRKQSFELNE